LVPLDRSRRRPSPSAPLLWIALAACLFLAGRPAQAQYLSAYKDGLDAIEAEDWERAAAAMSRAVGMRSEEKMKLPVRLFLRPYLPHFYLGNARFERGDCAGALAAWAESERQGVATKLPEFDTARRGRRICEERASARALTDAREDARTTLLRSATAADALLDRARDPQVAILWNEGDPSPADRHRSARDLLAQAERLLADAGVDAASVRRAEAIVRQADDIMGAVAVDLDRASEARRLEIEAKDQSIDTLVAEAKAVLQRTAYLAPYPRLVGKARADLEGLIAEAGRRSAGSKAHLDGLGARFEKSIETLTVLAAPPPDSLKKAVTAYLEGRHQDVIDGLAAARLPERRARAHARLLLSASRHALYLEGGELDDELLAAAAEDARACREDDETLAPTARFFSPRFVAFFTENVTG
jgi:hypothetical protein